MSNGKIRARLPSPGFVILAASFAAVAALFVWGSREPELDRCWRLLHEMKIGRIDRLDDARAELLRRTLVRYEDLCPALLDDEPAGLLSAHTGGWVETWEAWILADPKAVPDPVASVICGLEQAKYPVKISLDGVRDSVEIEFAGPGSRIVALSPKIRSGGGLIRVRLAAAHGDGAGGLDSGVQIDFPGAGK